MNYLGNMLFKQDFNIFIVILFGILGFLAGFFFNLSSKKGKSKFSKMETDASANQSRIAALKEKLQQLEDENRALGGKNIN